MKAKNNHNISLMYKLPLHKLTLLFLFTMIVALVKGQEEPNPFKSIGKKTKIATLSNGRFTEVIVNDSLQRVGSAIINTRTKAIVSLLNSDSLFRKNSDNSGQSRWYSIDRLAEKYSSWSPYNFVKNNPILYNDPNGDSLVSSGSATALSAFNNSLNAGLGGFYTVGQTNTGKYTLNSTGQEGSMTDQQQAFYNTLNGVITNSADVNFNIVDANDAVSKDVKIADNGQSVLSTTPGVHTIDIGDVQKFGTNGLITSSGIIAHELTEGLTIQTAPAITTMGQSQRNAVVNYAHEQGIDAENSVDNRARLGSEYSFSDPNRLQISILPSHPRVVPGQHASISVPKTVTVLFQNGQVNSVTDNSR